MRFQTITKTMPQFSMTVSVLDQQSFLTEEQLEKIGFKYDGDEPYPEPKEWTRENILEQLKSDGGVWF